MAVKIRMKMMGRKHRQFFRICATDTRTKRDGRVIEELGTYDPQVRDTDARTTFNMDRLSYWLSVGATPSERVATLIKKYGPTGTRIDSATLAKQNLKAPKAIPDPGVPKFVPGKAEEEAAAAAAVAAAAAANAPTEAAPAEGTAEAASVVSAENTPAPEAAAE